MFVRYMNLPNIIKMYTGYESYGAYKVSHFHSREITKTGSKGVTIFAPSPPPLPDIYN